MQNLEAKYALARQHMVLGQLLPNKVNDSRIVDAMSAIPRERFVPEAQAGVAYLDEDIPVKPGRYLMEPVVFARLLQAGEIQSHEKVLDAGCGPGYSIAVLAKLARQVVGLEADAELAEAARRHLREFAIANAQIVEAPLQGGCAALSPFDVIVVEGAVGQIPQSLIDQLAEGGRLLAVVRDETGSGLGSGPGSGRGVLVNRTGGITGSRELFDAQVPFLPGFDRPKRFVF